MQSKSSPPLRNQCDRRVTCNDPAMSKGRRFTFGPARQRFPNAQFRLLTGCQARHVHAYNFPWSSASHRRTVEARRQRGRKKYHKIRTSLFLHPRQSSKKQSTHQNSAHKLKVFELVALSVVRHLASGAFVSVSGEPEHATPPEVLLREIHLQFVTQMQHPEGASQCRANKHWDYLGRINTSGHRQILLLVELGLVRRPTGVTTSFTQAPRPQHFLKCPVLRVERRERGSQRLSALPLDARHRRTDIFVIHNRALRFAVSRQRAFGPACMCRQLSLERGIGTLRKRIRFE